VRRTGQRLHDANVLENVRRLAANSVRVKDAYTHMLLPFEQASAISCSCVNPLLAHLEGLQYVAHWCACMHAVHAVQACGMQ
jgi:hypothetical protein